EAKSLLFERFDGEVRRRLRIAGEEAKEALGRRKSAKAMGGGGDLWAARNRPAEPTCSLSLDASALPARLAKLAGDGGWSLALRFEVSSLRAEDKLVHLVL